MIAQLPSNDSKAKSRVYNKGNSIEFFEVVVYLQLRETPSSEGYTFMNWTAELSYTNRGKTKDLGDLSDVVHLSRIDAEKYPEWVDEQLQELGFDGTINYIEMLRL